MTNASTATPSAAQPPATTDAPPPAQGYADRWDWLRAAAFFCGAVFLLGLIPIFLLAWFSKILSTTPAFYDSYRFQVSQIILLADLVLPAALLIAGSVLSDRTFWGADGRSRLWAIGRLALALGVIAIVAALALAFALPLYLAMQPLARGFGVGASPLLIGIEDGLVLGVALAFVFRRLSQRTGSAWRAGLRNAALLAAGILALYTQLLSMWQVDKAWLQHPQYVLSCAGAAYGECFTTSVQIWLVLFVLPLVVGLLLGALIGAPLAYPYGARQARAPEAAAGTPHVPPAQGERSIWLTLGIAAGSFAAGLVATGARMYAAFQLYDTPLFDRTPPLYGTLIAVQLAPFAILALLCVVRLIRLPREQRPAAWSVGVLAFVSVLGLLPTLMPDVFLLPPLGAAIPSGRLLLGDSSFAFAASLGALLALCWWPATASSMRRTLTVALAGWLGVLLYWLGYSVAAQTPNAIQFLRYTSALEIALTAAIMCLPLMFIGVWMGSWLLAQRGLRSTPDAVA